MSNPEDPGLGIRVLVEGTNPVVDIIAIHDLGGHRDRTWTADNGVMWLQHEDFLPRYIPQARIMTYGYNSSVIDNMISAQLLFDHSMDLVSKLNLYRQQDNTEQRPIIFISHGFGGIILKTALYEARGHKDYGNIFESTRGILFMGVPQMGGDLADFAKSLLRSVRVAVPTNRELIKYLRRNAESFRHMLVRYMSIQTRFDTKVYYEMLPTKIGWFRRHVIVQKDSNSLGGISSVEVVGLHKDHKTSVKFRSPDDEDYQMVSGHLLVMVRHIIAQRAS